MLNELSKDELRQLKTDTVTYLQDINARSIEVLKKTDDRLIAYCEDVVMNHELHNLYELLAVKRFYYLLEKYTFKPVEVKRFIVYYESLYFAGMKGPTKYKLTPVQVFQFANIKGFYKSNGKRLIRDALLFVPRKFSKTTSVASLAIEDLIFGDANAQAYVAANSYDQAQICFNEIKNILKRMDRKLKHFKINREQIWYLKRSKTSFARCLASSPDKLDGLNASVVIVDEYAQADSADLKNVLTSSMGVRENPLTVIITTASEKLDGPFVELLNAYKSILRGELSNDSVFAHLFEPDVDDEEGDPRTWAKVQPHLGVTVQADYYENEWKKAQLTSTDMLTFRTKLLNIFVRSSAKSWIAGDVVQKLCKNTRIEDLEGRPEAMVAVDLSVRDDFSAVTYTIYNRKTKSFHSHTDYYIPEGILATHVNRKLYQRWVRDGYLKTCQGGVINYKMIAQDIIDNNKYLCILQIGYDPYKSLEFVNMVAALGAGKVLVPVPQTYGAFTSPVESMEMSVELQRITFSNNPITWWCFNNAQIDEDRMENRKPIKRAANDKIDGVITNVMTLWLFNNYTQ